MTDTITRATHGLRDVAHQSGSTFTVTPNGQSATIGASGSARTPGRETGNAPATARPMPLVADGWEDYDSPDGPFPTPSEGAFDPADSGGWRQEFIGAPELDRIADALIAAHPARLGHLAAFRIAFRWKRSGGGTTKPTLGDCKRLSGLARHALEAHFLVWLAADHLDALSPTNWHIEALLFHELLHASFDPKTAKPIVRDHDFSGFSAELTTYGLWHEDLFRASLAFVQLPMWDDEQWLPLASVGRVMTGGAA